MARYIADEPGFKPDYCDPGQPRQAHDHLPLPSGRLVGETDRVELARELIAAGVPGIDMNQSKLKNATAYAGFLAARSKQVSTKAFHEWAFDVRHRKPT